MPPRFAALLRLLYSLAAYLERTGGLTRGDLSFDYSMPRYADRVALAATVILD